MKKTVLLATQNAHKASEMKEILPDYEILTLKDISFEDDIEENGDSFEANALIKARAAHARSGLVCIADDSGLCVDSLGGRPGIYSARYSGGSFHDNNVKLLAELKEVPKERRTAQFVCSAACVYPNGRESVHTAKVAGHITEHLEGEEGFGYDPVFFCDEKNKTYANMSADEKNSVSHRKRAFEMLKCELDKYFEDEDITK